MTNKNDTLLLVLGFIAVMFFISQCTRVEINRANKKKPLIMYK